MSCFHLCLYLNLCLSLLFRTRQELFVCRLPFNKVVPRKNMCRPAVVLARAGRRPRGVVNSRGEPNPDVFGGEDMADNDGANTVHDRERDLELMKAFHPLLRFLL